MSTLIAGWIEAAITLSAALLLLKFYYSSEMPFFYKKKWVIVACAITMLYSLVEVTQAYRNYAQGRTPTKGEIQKAIAANNTLVDHDFVFTSPDGYNLVVPAGYAYTTFPSGAISMTAVKKLSQSPTQSVIIVERQQSSQELESLVKGVLKSLKSKNSTYAFSSESQLSINDNKAIRVDMNVEKEGIPLKGIFIFTTVGNNTFEFMMTCPTSVFSQESAEFEKVIQSIRLR